MSTTTQDQWRWFTLEAADVLFFRDGLPFDAGDSYWARGHWPPGIGPAQGFVRSLLLRHHLRNRGGFKALSSSNCRDLVERFGDAGSTGRLRFVGPWQCNSSDSWLPCPMDLASYEGKEYHRRRLSTPPATASLIGDKCPVSEWPAFEKDREPQQNLPGVKWPSYLTGELRDGDPIEASDRASDASHEIRVGLKRDEASRRAEPGHLFAKQVARPEETLQSGFQKDRLVIGIQGLQDEDIDILVDEVGRFGGEGFVARCSLADPTSLTSLESIQSVEPGISGRFQMVLITPGVYSTGWRPECIAPDGYLMDRLGQTRMAKLRGAMVGKPTPIGGWDRQNGRPKRMLRGVPPGSVYFFTLYNGISGSDVVKEYHWKPLPCPLSQSHYYESLGYGWTVVGRSV